MNQYRIVVVDDDLSVRKGLKRLISSFGFDVQTFGSGKDFLLSGGFDQIHCLVLDIHLPGMTGFELQSELELSGISIPIVFITAYDENADRERAKRKGAGFLRKPFEAANFMDAIYNSIHHSDKK
jgi:FixJ family two-component response regulator